MADRNEAGPRGHPGQHNFGVGERVAWSAGPHREEGEGVVGALLPPTPEDGQPRYRIRVFVDGRQSETELELVQGVLCEVPRWALQMPREERLRFHGGVTPPWNEEIETG
jgi:hypothetical protein